MSFFDSNTNTSAAAAVAPAPGKKLPHELNPRIPPPQPELNEDPTQLLAMITCQPYHSWDKYIDRVRDSVSKRVWEINRVDEMDERMHQLRELIYMGEKVWIVQGLFFEYVSGTGTIDIGLCS
ncbi:hypothetical protein I317_07721 [Kwoniella heveanensis CBS 569]|nr:hypothetical protein I317_07721 [Kwoniella heveanensis CBS 569]